MTGTGSRRWSRLRWGWLSGVLGASFAATLLAVPAVAGEDPPPAVKRCISEKFDAAARAHAKPPNPAEGNRIIEGCFQSVVGIGMGSGGKPPTSSGKVQSGTGVGGGCPSPSWLMQHALKPTELRIPTTAEIACNAKHARRLPLPRVVVSSQIASNPWNNPEFKDLGQTGSSGKVAYAARLRMAQEGYPSDIGFHRSQVLPPFGADVLHPQLLRDNLRTYQAATLAEKAAGKPVIFELVIAGPGTQWGGAVPTSASAFKRWLEQTVTPRIAMAAKAAEAVKAEMFVVPFELEPDVFLNVGTLRTLPAATRVTLAQALVSAGLKAARKHFKGLVVAPRGWQFHAPNPDSAAFWAAAPMEQVSYRGYDVVSSSFFPVPYTRCDEAYVTEYMDVQLRKTLELAQRDRVRWGVGEVDVFTLGTIAQYAGCGAAEPQVAHDPLLAAALDAILRARPRPAWVRFTGGPDEWQGDAAFRQRLGQQLAAFARELKRG